MSIRTLSSEAWMLILLVGLPVSYIFSRYLPPLTAFLTGSKLYTAVNYKYGQDSVFDNTILTWGTDYGLAVLMSIWSLRILAVSRSKKNAYLRLASAALLGSFALSTLAGAISHQFLYNSLNTAYFRFMWRICVGSVALAGGLLGSCATEIALTIDEAKEGKLRFPVLIVPHFFWVIYGLFFFWIVWTGLFSMKNPACDIFLTGVSQALPTIYLGGVLLSKPSWAVPSGYVYLLVIGLLSNILLLPGYDILNYLQWRDGICNVFLHSFLCFSWSSQGIAFQAFVNQLKNADKSE